LGHGDNVEEETDEELKQCTVSELKEKLKARNQLMGGSKTDLIIAYWVMRRMWRKEQK
jgi:hypothetical protein